MTPSPELPPRQAIEAVARMDVYPDGRQGLFLTAEAVAGLAREWKLPLRQVEIAALGVDVCPLRYARNLHAFSLAEQARLLASTAAMVGLGGLGGGLLESLVRSGVGRVRAADGDAFEETNLNRQLLSSGNALGVAKATVAAARAAAVNPSVEFSARDDFLDAAGMAELLAGADVAVDALGGLADRPALAQAARERGIPLVTGAVAGYTVIVATVLPGAASPVELLAGGGSAGAEDVLGCPSAGVMTAAALMSSEIVRLLAGREPALAGKALLADLETMRFDTVSF